MIPDTSPNIVRIVVITDHSVQTRMDSIWYSWKDASLRVQNLNEEFEEWGDEYHAHYFEEIVK